MLALVASFAALGGFLFGYDLGLIAGALLYMETDLGLTEGAEEVIVGTAKLGAVFGTFIGGALMQDLGRKRAIAWNSAFFIAGPVIMASAPNASVVSLGRFVVGLGVGVSAVVVPAYVGEMAPPKKRGAVVITYELMLCFGMIASGVMDFALRDARDNWRWMVGAPVVPALAMLLSIVILPESPRWLVIRGELTEALEVIHKLRERVEMPGRDQSTAQVEAELMELWSAVEKEYHEVRGGAARGGGGGGGGGGGSGWLTGGSSGEIQEIVPSPRGREAGEDDGNGNGTATTAHGNHNQADGFFRTLLTVITDVGRVYRGPEQRAFRLALWLAFFNQACCSTSVINFAPKILERAGVDERDDAVLFASAVSVTKAAGVTLSMFLVDRAGRRFLLVAGSFAAAVAMACLAVAYAANDAFAALLFMCGFMLAFSASWAGVFWVLMSELFSMRAKSAAMSATTALLFATGAVTDFVFLSVASAMGGWVFGLIACVCVAGGLYVQMELPETKGATLAEVQAMLASGGDRAGDGDSTEGGLSSWARRFIERLRAGGAARASEAQRRYAELT